MFAKLGISGRLGESCAKGATCDSVRLSGVAVAVGSSLTDGVVRLASPPGGEGGGVLLISERCVNRLDGKPDDAAFDRSLIAVTSAWNLARAARPGEERPERVERDELERDDVSLRSRWPIE